MPSLAICCFVLFLSFGVESLKLNTEDVNVKNYTQSPIETFSGHNQNAVYCNFMENKCSWSATAIWKWVARNGGPDPIQYDGPQHESKFYKYHPLIANFNSRKGFQQKQYLTSPEFKAPPRGDSCFTFEYYTRLSNGANDGLTLYLVNEDDKSKTAIWARGGSELDVWRHAKVDIVTNKNFTLVFEAYGQHGFVGLEQFELHDIYCELVTSTTYVDNNFDCDFEGGLCHGWTADDFEVVKAASSKFKTPIDHTSRSQFGHFALYTGPESIGEIGQARLGLHELQSIHEKECLTFFFKRTSRNASLSLQMRFTGNGTKHTLWKSNDTYPLNQWISVQQLFATHEKIKFVLEATIHKESDVGDIIAIDDVSLWSDRCQDLISCSFYDQFCGWEPNTNVGLRWSQGTGRVEQADKLKTKKHIETGQYVIYSDFTTISNNETASMELISQLIPPHQDGSHCFRIDLNVIALGPGDEFSISQLDSHDKRRVIWDFKDLNRTAEDSWIKKIGVWIPNLSAHEPSRLTLTAKSSHAFTRIAIEDVQLLKDQDLCKSGASTTPKPSTKPTSIKHRPNQHV